SPLGPCGSRFGRTTPSGRGGSSPTAVPQGTPLRRSAGPAAAGGRRTVAHRMQSSARPACQGISPLQYIERSVPTVRVVLVEPKNEGNVGAVARAMKNFGAGELVFVNLCRFGPEPRQRVMHVVDSWDAARWVDRFAVPVNV